MESFLKIFDLTVQDGQMILVCAFLFTIFIHLMHRNLFGPMMNLIDSREAASTGAQQEAATLEQLAIETDRQREQRIASARAEFVKQKLEKIAASKREAEAIIHSAEAQAKTDLEAARAKIEAYERSVRAELNAGREPLIQAAVSQVIGEGGSRSA